MLQSHASGRLEARFSRPRKLRARSTMSGSDIRSWWAAISAALLSVNMVISQVEAERTPVQHEQVKNDSRFSDDTVSVVATS